MLEMLRFKQLFPWMLLLALITGIEAFAQCRPPQYREGAIFADSGSVIVMSVSIPLYDFAPSKLVCLATNLREHYRDRRNIEINMFSSHVDSQRGIYVQESNREDVEALSHMHARYNFDADKHEDYIEIMPTGVFPGLRAGPFNTRIDLPVETTPHCKLEINDRCLIALQQFPYPAALLKRKPSGTVTLAATITRSGKVDHIRLLKAESISANEAVQNLSSWRLEPGPRDEPIQITYSYAIDNSLRYIDGMQVHWALPNEVSITIPPE